MEHPQPRMSDKMNKFWHESASTSVSQSTPAPQVQRHAQLYGADLHIFWQETKTDGWHKRCIASLSEELDSAIESTPQCYGSIHPVSHVFDAKETLRGRMWCGACWCRACAWTCPLRISRNSQWRWYWRQFPVPRMWQNDSRWRAPGLSGLSAADRLPTRQSRQLILAAPTAEWWGAVLQHHDAALPREMRHSSWCQCPPGSNVGAHPEPGGHMCVSDERVTHRSAPRGRDPLMTIWYFP